MFTFLNMLAMVVSEADSVPTFVLGGLRGSMSLVAMLHTKLARPRLAIGQSTPREKAPLAGVERRIFLRHHFVIGVCLVQTIII